MRFLTSIVRTVAPLPWHVVDIMRSAIQTVMGHQAVREIVREMIAHGLKLAAKAVLA